MTMNIWENLKQASENKKNVAYTTFSEDGNFEVVIVYCNDKYQVKTYIGDRQKYKVSPAYSQLVKCYNWLTKNNITLSNVHKWIN